LWKLGSELSSELQITLSDVSNCRLDDVDFLSDNASGLRGKAFRGMNNPDLCKTLAFHVCGSQTLLSAVTSEQWVPVLFEHSNKRSHSLRRCLLCCRSEVFSRRNDAVMHVFHSAK